MSSIEVKFATVHKYGRECHATVSSGVEVLLSILAQKATVVVNRTRVQDDQLDARVGEEELDITPNRDYEGLLELL